jgi:hypothetical protein
MTSAEDVAREWLQCSDSVVMFGSAETIDTTVQSLAAIILRERKEAAEAESVRLLACLKQIRGPACNPPSRAPFEQPSADYHPSAPTQE